MVNVAPRQANAVAGAVSVNIEREHQKGLALVNPLVQELGKVQITNELEYQAADVLLGKIRVARKGWGTIWTAIQERVIKPQRDALEGVYSINREVDGPLERGEKFVKSEMALYKDEERKQLEKANREREAEAERVQQQIEATRAKLATASGSVKGVLTRNLGRLDAHQQAVMEQVPMAVQGVNSSTRVVKVLKVSNLLLLAQYLASEEVDPDKDPAAVALLQAVEESLQKSGRTQYEKERLAQWPGVSLMDTTQIVGR
jgi:hypothetical protein